MKSADFIYHRVTDVAEAVRYIDHVLLRLSGVQMAKPPSEEGQP